jgi:hypothetical protein
LKTLAEIVGVLPAVPEYKQRRIYWFKTGGIAFILVGYCPDTLDNFLALFNDARKTFPGLRLEDISCGKVSKSNTIYGFTLIRFDVKGPRKKYRGWDGLDGKHLDFNY